MLKKIVIIILLIGCFCTLSYYDHNYTREDCKVIQINDGWVTIQDNCGLVWDCEAKGLKVGDVVDLKMYDNLTPATISDDIVKKVVKNS